MFSWVDPFVDIWGGGGIPWPDPSPCRETIGLPALLAGGTIPSWICPVRKCSPAVQCEFLLSTGLVPAFPRQAQSHAPEEGLGAKHHTVHQVVQGTLRAAGHTILLHSGLSHTWLMARIQEARGEGYHQPDLPGVSTAPTCSAQGREWEISHRSTQGARGQDLPQKPRPAPMCLRSEVPEPSLGSGCPISTG